MLNVVSAFDGCSCARLAIMEHGIGVRRYRSFEIDKYAIEVSNNNFIDVEQCGDINNWREHDLSNVDLLIAGFPCQSWSRAGYGKGLEDERGSISLQLVNMFNEMKKLNPSLMFLFENIKMKDEDRKFFDDLFGVKSVAINSTLVSGQVRSRLYWCNWDVRIPEDKGIKLNDLLVNGFSDRDKSYCIDANYHKGGRQINQYLDKSRRQIVFNQEVWYDRPNRIMHYGNGKTIIADDIQKADLKNPQCDGELRWRHLYPIEGERLQGMPDYFTATVSNKQRWKMIGNGFNIPTIVHLLKEGIICQ